jgi:hypothetical protein
MSAEHTEEPLGHTSPTPAGGTPRPARRGPSERFRRRQGGRLKTLRAALQTFGDESWLDAG